MKLRIEKAIYGGAGLARVEEGEDEIAGKTAFVPLTLAGELVAAHVVEDKRSFVNAELDVVLEPSLLRTTARCPYFGICGGCSYQHSVYAHQVEIKAAILRELLSRAGLSQLPPVHTVSGEAWKYRNRIRLHTRAEPFALCYRARRSHHLLPVSECPIAAPLLEKAIRTVTEVGGSLRLAEFCDEIEFFTADEGVLMLSLFASKKAKEAWFPAVCAALQVTLPLRGAALFGSEGRQPAHLIQSWGESSLIYKTAAFEYQVSAGSFFQINRFLADALVDLVTAERKGRLAWDLYAGVGLFARALTETFERVIAVEPSRASFLDLQLNLQGTSHRAIQASTLQFLQKQKPSSTPPDLVVLDPPRAGLGHAVLSELIRIGPAQIAYVSCDPATLSRDLAALVTSSYDLRTITMVDLFPQTFHLESVSVLTRR